MTESATVKLGIHSLAYNCTYTLGSNETSETIKKFYGLTLVTKRTRIHCSGLIYLTQDGIEVDVVAEYGYAREEEYFQVGDFYRIYIPSTFPISLH